MNWESRASEWFSPMLVKELRQGLRTNTFVIAFLAIQAVMLVALISCFPSAGETKGVADFASGFILTILWGSSLMMVARGFRSLTDEGKNLELLLLTRMSALRIVAGKWSSLVIQFLLFITALLPYVCLRYYFSNTEILEDFLSILMMMLGTAIGISLTVAISAVPHRFVRIAITTVFLLSCITVVPGLIVALYSSLGRTTTSDDMVWILLGMACQTPLFILLAMGIGSTFIAPPSENYSILKKYCGLAAFFPPLILYYIAPTSAWVTALGLGIPIVFISMADSLMEEARILRILARPFVKYGSLGRLAARLLYPGWPSGVLFFLLCTVVEIIIGLIICSSDKEAFMVVMLTLTSCALYPLAILKFFLPDSRQTIPYYVGLQCSMWIFSAITAFASISMDGNMWIATALYPVWALSSLKGMTSPASAFKNPMIAMECILGIQLVLALLILAWRIIPYFSKMKQMEDEEIKQLALLRQKKAEAPTVQPG